MLSVCKNDGMAKQAIVFYKQLAMKRDQPYSSTTAWLCLSPHILIASLCIQCIRGTRSSFGHAIKAPPIDLSISEHHYIWCTSCIYLFLLLNACETCPLRKQCGFHVWCFSTHKFSSSLSQIEAEYRLFCIKRYLHLSSFSLCGKCANATLWVCEITAILSDIQITKRQCGSRWKGWGRSDRHSEMHKFLSNFSM